MISTYNRREFLGSASTWSTVMGATMFSSASGLGVVQGEQTATNDTATGDSAVPIVDTHQHLWDLTKLKLGWLKNQKSFNRSFLMSDYLQATQRLNVVKTVYMEVNVEPSYQVKEAEYVIDLCERDDNPMAAAVIGGSPQSKSFKDYIEKFADNKYIKGVRTVLHDENRERGMCLKPQFVENIKLLGELGMSYDLCMRPDELLDGAKLIDQCPRTRFVLDHCGNMSVTSRDTKLREAWKKGIRELAQREHVVCKISGIVVTANEKWKPADLAPNMTFCMDAFGEDRAYFAGDWPVCTLRATFRQWSDALKWIVRDKPPAFKKKLFHDNAVKFYELS